MHCVVNELGKGLLHKAITIWAVRWLWCGQCGTGKRREAGGTSVSGQSAPHYPPRHRGAGRSGAGSHREDSWTPVPAPPKHLACACTETGP